MTRYTFPAAHKGLCKLLLASTTVLGFFSGLPRSAAADARILGAAERAAARSGLRESRGRMAERRAHEAAARTGKDRVVAEWTTALCKPSKPCSLPEHVGSSFRGGSYREVVLGRDTLLHRSYSDQANRLGASGANYSYWSRGEPTTGLKAVIDRAIPVSTNGNLATRSATILVPRGTTVYEGTAAGLRRGPAGGGNQVVVTRVKSEWVQ